MTVFIIVLLVAMMPLLFLLGILVDKHNRLKSKYSALKARYKDLETLYKDGLTQNEILKSIVNKK
jgi:hypothetical protein